MKLDFSEGLAESHHVSEWPLVGSDFAQRSAHKDCSELVDDQDFSNVEGVSPENAELLGSSFPIELSEIFCIADNHHIKDTVICSTYCFRFLFPHFEDLSALTVHHLARSIRVLTEHVHVPVDKVQLLDVITRTETDGMENFVLVWTDDDYLVRTASNQFMAEFRVPD